MIGLDSADRGLVDQWCDSGELPVLRSMIERGAYGRLASPPAMGDDGTWASFSTAVSPGRHGRYFWQSLVQGAYTLAMSRDEAWPEEPFWAALSRSGLRVAVLDVPKCPLVAGLNGVQLADWQVHGRDYARTLSWPQELAESVLGRFGDDGTDQMSEDWLCWLHALPDAKLEVFESRLLEGLAKKTLLVSELLAQDDWDLFLVVFKEAHCVGHQCWHLLEKADDTGPEGRRATPVKAIYQALDSTIGEIAGQSGPGTTVIVFSDLGMGPNHTGEHLLDRVLCRLERRLATPRQRARLMTRRIHERLTFRRRRGEDAGRSRAGRLAYQVEHNEISGAIRINLTGREPAGIVSPGREYDDCCRRLTEELLALRDPRTGDALVESVVPAARIYPGPCQDRLPDLFAVWARTGPITGAQSPAIGRLMSDPPGFRPGNHVPGGFYIGVGPAVTPGRRGEPASIMDLGPTVARLLRTPLLDRDGRPVPELCGP